jgi:N-methylhydantoinase A
MGSGPAGGVMGATAVAGAAGVTDFISVDMGGTSYDVCLVRGGEPEVKAGWNWHHRYLSACRWSTCSPSAPAGLDRARRGGRAARSGRGARAPSRARLLRPRRHRADRHRREPRARLPEPDAFCGGTMRLDVEGAHAAIRERVAKPLGSRSSRRPTASSAREREHGERDPQGLGADAASIRGR